MHPYVIVSLYFVAVLLLVINIFILARGSRERILAPGDIVLITGAYNPDNGWIKEMKKYRGQAGEVISYDPKHDEVIIVFADGASWSFSRGDVTK